MVKTKGKIFIADTDQKSVVLIKDALKAQGYSIYSAINGAKALEIIIEQLPDIIILGMKLPIIDTEKLRDIISVNPRTDKLALIFMGTPEQLKSVSTMGEKVITKPFRIDELISTISSIYQKRQKTIELSRENKEIEGNLSQISLIDLLQIFSMNKKDGTITIYSDKGNGFIYLQEGNIINATFEKVEGVKAFYRLLSVKNGKFEFIPHRALTPIRITSTTESLLMEGMRQIDEMKKNKDVLPPLDAIVRLKKKLSELPKQVRTITQEVLLLLEFYNKVADIMDNCTFPDYDVLRVLVALIEKGIIEIVQHETPKASDREGALLANEEIFKLLEVVSINKHTKLESHRGRVIVLSANYNSLKTFVNSINNMPKFTLNTSFAVSNRDDVIFGEVGTLLLTELLSIEIISVPPLLEYGPLWMALSSSAVGAIVLFDKGSKEILSSFLSAVNRFKNAKALPIAYVFVTPNGQEVKSKAISTLKKLLSADNDDPIFVLNKDTSDSFNIIPTLLRKVINQ
jgi:CheY-like chemotaxis protein